MSTHVEKSFILKLCDRVSRAATAFHLWCAEQELRLADTSDLPKELAQARSHNLDQLREYRRRGEFPQHQRGLIGALPCFIDDAGRQCAVACLMHRSGAGEAVSQIARHANFARIREMAFPDLNVWADTSGFTQAELARIQPNYDPNLEQLERYREIVLVIWSIGSGALLSIFVNAWSLFFAWAASFRLALLSTMFGLILIGVSLQASDRAFGRTPLRYDLEIHQLIAFNLGMACVCAAWLPYCRSNSKPRETS